MTLVFSRMRQCVISLVGTLLFLPVYLFWGGVFSFSFNLRDSAWAWGFGLVACWSQILALMFSFAQPRKAAYWMLVNTGASVFLAMGCLAETAHGGAVPHELLGIWPYAHSGFWTTGLIFWAMPPVFAVLLLRRPQRVQEG